MSKPQESTVLLVDPSSLPSRLEESLNARACFVETAEADQLSGTLLVSTPDLIIASQKHIDEACRCVRAADITKTLPLLLIAPRGSLSSLRMKTPAEVSAVVPFDMPVSAIVVRVQTLLKRVTADEASSPQKRAARNIGAARAPMKTLLGAGARSSVAPPSPPPVTSRAAFSKTMVGLAPGENPTAHVAGAADAPSEGYVPAALGGRADAPQVPPVAHEGNASAQAVDLRPAFFGEEKTGFVEEKTGIKSARVKGARVKGANPPSPSPARAPTNPGFPEVKPSPGAYSTSARTAAIPAPLADDFAQGELLPAKAKKSWGHNQPEHQKPRSGARRLDASTAAGGASTRVSLEMPATSLPGLRIALLDEDVTRADTVSSALREAGHKVFLVSNTSGVTRWALLRRFSPQVVLVDEQSLARDGGHWLSQFRADPFLRSTSLVACPLETVFDERRGTTNLSLLSPQLEGLGKVEVGLVSQLSPRREVEIGSNQLSPARLVALLSELSKPVTLHCSTASEVLTWPLKDGQVGQGRIGPLREPNGPTRGQPISPSAALDFLLDHPDATIVVKQEWELSLSSPRGITELLDAAYSRDLPQAIPQAAARSIPPPAFAPNYTPALSPIRSLGPPVADYMGEEEDDERDRDSELPTRPISLAEIQGIATQMKPSRPAAARTDSRSNELMQARANQSAPPPMLPSSDAIAPSLAEYNRVQTTDQDTSPASDDGHRHTPQVFARLIPAEVARTVRAKRRVFTWAGAAAVGLGALVSGWSLVGSDDDAKAERTDGASDVGPLAPAKATTPAAHAPVSKPPSLARDEAPTSQGSSASADEDAASESVALFRVRTAGELESCEVLLKQPLSFYQGKPRWEGQAIWKKARQQLLMGERDTAHQLMCQAAFIDPTGPASVGLAGYYLANRSLKNAEVWALYGLEQRPDFPRKSQELLGDVLIQMGKVHEAREIWLKTMNLNKDDQGKLRAVARTLTASAKKARRGGDFPLAERLLRRAVTFDGTNGAAAADLAVALYKNDQPGIAKRWAQRALSLNANSGEALYVLGELALAAGDKSEARRNFSQIPPGSVFFEDGRGRLKSL